MVRIQLGAGHEAAFNDSAYTEAGGATAPDGPSSVAGAGLVVQVNPPSVEQVATLPQGVSTLSFFGVAQSEDARSRQIVCPESFAHYPPHYLSLGFKGSSQEVRRASLMVSDIRESCEDGCLRLFAMASRSSTE
jgi:hypothetical protein